MIRIGLTILPFLVLCVACCSIGSTEQGCNSLVKFSPAALADLEIGGELEARILRNYDRLERGKYLPENVFLTEEESLSWPGDTEGRTMLALIMEAQASKRPPKTLDAMMARIPSGLNSKGYMGRIYPDGVLDEQQLSGNGWMLRALCEYYTWKGDKQMFSIARTIVDSLFLPGAGRYKNYPIAPELRAIKLGAGQESGWYLGERDGWRYSSDVGCMFIGMAGLIHYYDLTRDERVQGVIEEMIARFEEVDLIAMSAQTHASLTSMRALLRYAVATGDHSLIDKVEEYWSVYLSHGMTENYANYNWFDRFNSWTEPCAIVDSYIVANTLWMITGEKQYLDTAELIYYNGLCYAQRDNGGFGCDKCVGKELHTICTHIDEAHWCCTMRGGDGLSRVAQFSYFTSPGSVDIAHFGQSRFHVATRGGSMTVSQYTAYPLSDNVDFVLSDVKGTPIGMRINAQELFVEYLKVKINGVDTDYHIDNGFVVLNGPWKENDCISFTFVPKLRLEKPFNTTNCSSQQHKVFDGVLLLGCDASKDLTISDVASVEKLTPNRFRVKGTEYELTPLYHLMSPRVHLDGECKQLLF